MLILSVARSFSSTSCCHDSAAQAESSTNLSRFARQAGERPEQAFRRNIKDVETFRRRRDALSSYFSPIVADDKKLNFHSYRLDQSQLFNRNQAQHELLYLPFSRLEQH